MNLLHTALLFLFSSSSTSSSQASLPKQPVVQIQQQVICIENTDDLLADYDPGRDKESMDAIDDAICAY